MCSTAMCYVIYAALSVPLSVASVGHIVSNHLVVFCLVLLLRIPLTSVLGALCLFRRVASAQGAYRLGHGCGLGSLGGGWRCWYFL